jgi:hypothetical protein
VAIAHASPRKSDASDKPGIVLRNPEESSADALFFSHVADYSAPQATTDD